MSLIGRDDFFALAIACVLQSGTRPFPKIVLFTEFVLENITRVFPALMKNRGAFCAFDAAVAPVLDDKAQ